MNQSVLSFSYIRAAFGHHAVPRLPEVGADGSCPVCDHPFGEMAHMCLGSLGPISLAS